MNRATYYESLKQLARDKRSHYGIETDAFGLREMRAIYKAEGVRIDKWSHPLRKVRAAYLVVDGAPHVMLNAAMAPIEPRLFSLAHELKHHYTDQELVSASCTGLGCAEYNSYSRVPPIEIGAEVFAAELIFPEEDFRTWVDAHLKGKECTKEEVVRLKRCCPAKVSYTFIVKRLERLGYVQRGVFSGVRFQKLEETIYGLPIYKRIRRARPRSAPAKRVRR